MTTTQNAGRGPGSAATAHLCPVGGCRQKVRADRLMCRHHWFRVPRRLRDAVWATWRSGAGTGTLAHAAAITAAVTAVEAASGGAISTELSAVRASAVPRLPCPRCGIRELCPGCGGCECDCSCWTPFTWARYRALVPDSLTERAAGPRPAALVVRPPTGGGTGDPA